MLRRLMMIFAVLIIAYLVLVHYTGFSKDVATIASGTGELVKDFQGN